MLAREYHYRWEWDLRANPAALWPLVADTNRFNHDTGVAVTLNERLDYFGSTGNIAARLEALAGGLTAEPFQAELKGYEGERFQLWAVRPAA